MARRITDFLLVPNRDWAVSDEVYDAHPPAVGPLASREREEVDLGTGVFIRFVPDADALMTACEPRGENFDPTRQYGQRYVFVRPDAPGSNWDEDGALMACVALSRLVVPTAADMTYAGRIEETPGQPRVILPAWNGFRCWVPYPDRRQWLDLEEAHALAVLHERWLSVKDSFPERVRDANWKGCGSPEVTPDGRQRHGS